MELVIVAAVAENGVIGAEGGMPWHYPADLKHFKRTTTGHPVIVGRRTFEGIVERLGEPLPDRTSIVLTTRGAETIEADVDHENVRVVGSIDAAISAAGVADTEVAHVVGGASVYEQFLPKADRMVLTEIHHSHEGDAYFPAYDDADWIEVDRTNREELSFVTYERGEG